MIHINSDRRESILIQVDEDLILAITYNKKTNKERIFVIPAKEYKYLEKIPNKEAVFDIFLDVKKYKKIYSFEDLKNLKKAIDGIYLIEIDKEDEKIQELLKNIIPNYNKNESIVKQIITNNILKKD
ncbi:MAG: hypothetical protein QXW13_00105 [Nanopusillaceae archaeon]